MIRYGVGALGVLMGLALTAGAEWQISADHRVGYLERVTLENTSQVKPWGVDTVSGATQKADQQGWITENNVTASHIEAAASRTVGMRVVTAKGIDTAYAHPRLSNLILAWHGAAGGLDAGYVRKPLSWGEGLLAERVSFSGGRARIDWGTSGQSEGFWTDTLEDSRRFRYDEVSLAGFRQTVQIPEGQLGVGVLDTSRVKSAIFPKAYSSRGTFTTVNLQSYPYDRMRVYAEAVYARLLDDRVKDTRAGLLGCDYALAPGIQVSVRGWYLGDAYNPPTGFYNIYGNEEGNAGFKIPMSWWQGFVRFTPGWGWKQRASENFWVPEGGVEWYWRSLGTTLKIFERAEQPVGQWGAEGHWEYTGASLSWESPWAWALTGRWEKIYNGFLHSKLQQWSAEIVLRY